MSGKQREKVAAKPPQLRCHELGGINKDGSPCRRPVRDSLCKAHRPNGEELSERQWLFCQEYIKDLNGTAAVKRAGYSENGADVAAFRLLMDVRIKAAITKLKAERSARTRITADRVLEELAKIGFADLRELMTWNDERGWFIPSAELTDEQAAAISEVQSETIVTTFGKDDENETRRHKMRIKTWDKLSALEKIAKHLGIFAAQEVKHSGAVETTAPHIHIYMPDNMRIKGNGGRDAVAAAVIAEAKKAPMVRVKSGNGGPGGG